MLHTRSERQAAPLPMPIVESQRIRFGAESGVTMPEVLEALAGLLRYAAGSRGAKLPMTARIVVDLRSEELAVDGVFDEPED